MFMGGNVVKHLRTARDINVVELEAEGWKQVSPLRLNANGHYTCLMEREDNVEMAEEAQAEDEPSVSQDAGDPHGGSHAESKD